MSDQGLPTAAFGKAAGQGDGFGVLWSRSDFPDGARQALGDIARAFGLRGDGGDGEYPPCFALWPIRSPVGWVAVRLRDAGNDAIGRPHTLRIDAVFVEGDDLALAAGLLKANAWPEGDWDEATAFFSTMPTPDHATADVILGVWNGETCPTVLRACHTWYTSGFDVNLDTDGSVLRCRQRPSLGTQAGVKRPRAVYDGGGTVRGRGRDKRSTMKQAFSILVAASLGAAAAFGWHLVETGKLQQEHEAVASRLASERDDARTRADDAQQRQSRLEKEMKSLSLELQDLRNSSQAEKSFESVAKDFHLHNAHELREALKQIRPGQHRDESPQKRVPRILDDMESLLRDLRQTWINVHPAAEHSSPESPQ